MLYLPMFDCQIVQQVDAYAPVSYLYLSLWTLEAPLQTLSGFIDPTLGASALKQ